MTGTVTDPRPKRRHVESHGCLAGALITRGAQSGEDVGRRYLVFSP